MKGSVQLHFSHPTLYSERFAFKLHIIFIGKIHRSPIFQRGASTYSYTPYIHNAQYCVVVSTSLLGSFTDCNYWLQCYEFVCSLSPQYIHPFEAEAYRETVRAIRTIGRDCIKKRIAMVERGVEVPNDILTHILGLACEFKQIIIVQTKHFLTQLI